MTSILGIILNLFLFLSKCTQFVLKLERGGSENLGQKLIPVSKKTGHRGKKLKKLQQSDSLS